jgi:hypothetical protein
VRVGKRLDSASGGEASGAGGGERDRCGHGKQRGKCRECREERADGNAAEQQAALGRGSRTRIRKKLYLIQKGFESNVQVDRSSTRFGALMHHPICILSLFSQSSANVSIGKPCDPRILGPTSKSWLSVLI